MFFVFSNLFLIFSYHIIFVLNSNFVENDDETSPSIGDYFALKIGGVLLGMAVSYTHLTLPTKA